MTTDDLARQFPGKEKSIGDLTSFLNNGGSNFVNYALFLGAGASVTSGIPTGSGLVSEWRSDLLRQLDPHSTLDDQDEIKKWLTTECPGYISDSEYGYLFERKFSMPKQRRDFIERTISGKLPSIGYPYLVRLAEKKAFNVMFTTNFDDLLNEAFYQFSSERPLVCAHDSSISGVSVASSRTKIIKLHGDCLYNNLKNTGSETDSLEVNMEDKIREFAKICGLIVVGYSGGDHSVMRIFHQLIDDPTYFQNGLYWCFRRGEQVSSETARLLRKSGCFYVLIDGFDELMADLYAPICGNMLPFNARPGSDFAAQIISGYLKDENLANSKNETIRSHVAMLAEEQNSSLVAEALKTLYKEQGDDAKIRDADFIKYLELERLFRSRDYKLAFEHIRQYIDNCSDIHFKRILAERLFYAANALYQPEEAVRAIDMLRHLQPENFFLCLALSDVTHESNKRLEILRSGVKNAPYEEAVQHRYASELESQFHTGIEKGRPSVSEVIDAYRKAIKLNPVIGNPAWRDLFVFLKSPFSASPDRSEILNWIVDEHMSQDGYDYRSIGLLVEWARVFNLEDYKGNKISALVIDAFEKHFPRRYSGHLSVIRDLCIHSGQFAALNEVLPICEKEPGIEFDPSYVNVKMDLLYRVYRDLDSAIKLGECFVKRRPSVLIENSLFSLYLAKGDVDKGRYQLDRLTGAVDMDSYLKLKVDLFDCSKKFADAIDVMNLIAKRKGEDDDYVATTSFLQLRMGDFKGAFETTKKFFDKNNFSLRYEAAMINYEYSRHKLKKSISQSRLESLGRQSSNKGVMAVVDLLLGRESQALEKISELIKSDFSMLCSCLRWPALSSVRDKISDMTEALIAERRSFPEADSISSPKELIIDV